MDGSLPAREPSYEVFEPIASGGMAMVHLGRRRGAAGFARVVAVKRLHPHLAAEPDLVAMLMDEARLSARVRHTNVVSVLDVVEDGGLSLVMEYVHGAALSQLVRAASARGERVPAPIASAIVVGVLAGLHAAHEAKGEDGAPLHLVHRDVSPQNILVGTDGAARIADFGIAKARGRAHVTREGSLKGKLAYMAPEQLEGAATRRTDVLAAGVVLWELFAGRRFYEGVDDDAHLFGAILTRAAPPLAPFAPDLPGEASAVVERALRKEPEERFATADEMARALRDACPPAPPSEVGAWVERLVGDTLARRAAQIARIEGGEPAPPSVPPSLAAPGSARNGAPVPPDGPRPLHARAPLPGAVEGSHTVTIEDLAARRRGPSRARRAWWIAAPLIVIAIAAAAARAVGGAPPPGADTSPGRVEDEKNTSPSNSASPGSNTASPGGDTPSPQQAPSPGDDAASPASDIAASAGDTASPAAAPGPSVAPAASSAARGAAQVPPGKKGAPRPGASGLAAKPGCDPPWELDGSGIKRIKRACLQ